jgi:hypothetical protein
MGDEGMGKAYIMPNKKQNQVMGKYHRDMIMVWTDLLQNDSSTVCLVG